ncbi:hypothetical protein NDU88_004698 [Pleurodeles waltl]|uniref:Uncharacterized protein n=1 Tax=Pleurodeles waltl TaxID=8319 RepID=A0AAV7WXD7_PLEWA|nr:hypothetical protein NDU88_004698 [Pleurodeles waltl]
MRDIQFRIFSVSNGREKDGGGLQRSYRLVYLSGWFLDLPINFIKFTYLLGLPVTLHCGDDLGRETIHTMNPQKRKSHMHFNNKNANLNTGTVVDQT